jgi:hypothetical protein
MKRIAVALATAAGMMASLAFGYSPAQAAPVERPDFALTAIDGPRFVVNVRYNECLALVGGGIANGTPIGHYPCNAGPQPWFRWTFEFQGNKLICDYEDFLGNCNRYVEVFLYRLHSEQNGKCFEPKGGGTSSGTTLEQWDCRTGTLRQSWILGNGPNGGYFFFNAKAYDEGQHLRAIDAPPFAQDYRVRLWTGNGTTAQEWWIQ